MCGAKASLAYGRSGSTKGMVGSPGRNGIGPTTDGAAPGSAVRLQKLAIDGAPGLRISLQAERSAQGEMTMGKLLENLNWTLLAGLVLAVALMAGFHAEL